MEFNKAIAALLIAGIAFFLSGFIGDNLVSEKPLKELALKIDLPTAAAPAGTPPPAALPPIAVLLAKADVAAGEASTKKLGCIACHSFNEGGKAGIGPNLYGVVGGPVGHMEGYSYSKALLTKKEAQPTWTFAALNEWLAKPAAYAPGTKMTYAGVGDNQERANVIAYLNTLAKSPLALPAPTEAELHPVSASAAAPAAAPGDAPIGPLLAAADPARGEADTKKLGCIACHTFASGGKAGLGPNLYGVVGAPHAHMEGFNYSAALKAHQGPWTYDELNVWLKKPAAYAPGTKMTFVGVADEKDRADIIAYLRTLAANPEPLPVN
jgi:cytochrome c